MMKVKRRTNFIFCFLVVGILLTLLGACKKTEVKAPPQSSDVKSQPRVPPANPVDVIADFVFAGWMGDQSITLDDGCTENPHSPPTCVKITYRPGGQGWAGIYAQYNVQGPGNWGDRPGKNLTGYTKLVWYAKGETGNEMVEFKAGGIDASGKQYRDSFEVTKGTVRLNTNWTRYELDLTNYDLSSVIGGFCWVATARSNPNGLTFYVDSITYE